VGGLNQRGERGRRGILSLRARSIEKKERFLAFCLPILRGREGRGKRKSFSIFGAEMAGSFTE